MRRPPRILVNGLAALSLALAGGDAVLWACSRTWGNSVAYHDGSTERWIGSVWGTIHFGVATPYPTSAPGVEWDRYPVGPPDPVDAAAPWFERLGFKFLDVAVPQPSGPPTRWVSMSVSHAFVLPVVLILPGAWLVRWVRERPCDGETTMCRRCGYDLRATPDRCPECGQAVR